jgi:SAM-dependent methyltransferase
MASSIDPGAVATMKARIIEEHGPWTAHSIDLGGGVATMEGGSTQLWRVEWFKKLIDRHGRDLRRRRRLLDLACLEGLFAIEFARMGWDTVGIEIRDAHLAKAEFARRVIGLDSCRFVKGDVRSIPPTLGRFDAVAAAGILYHLDFPDCVRFLRDIAERSTDLVLIDSHFAYDQIETSVAPLSEVRTYAFDGREYRGREYREHAPHVTDDEKDHAHVWSSIDNDVSVWLSEPDVVAVMAEQGFALAERAFPDPTYEAKVPDRPTLTFRRVGEDGE